MNEAQQRNLDRAMSVLKQAGYKPEIKTHDGECEVKNCCHTVVWFEKGPRTFIVPIDDDEKFFRLVLPRIKDCDNVIEEATMIPVTHKITSEVKMAKCYVRAGTVDLACEMFTDVPGSWGLVLEHMISTIETAHDLFGVLMKPVSMIKNLIENAERDTEK